MAEGIDGQRRILTSFVQRTIPVGFCINRWEGSAFACTEHHSLNALYWCKEHALTCLLAIDVNLYHSLGYTENGFDVVGLMSLVFAQSTISGTPLASHDTFVSQFDARAGCTMFVQEFNLQ